MRARLLISLMMVVLVGIFAGCSRDDADTPSSDDLETDDAAGAGADAAMDVDEEYAASEPAADRAPGEELDGESAGASAASIADSEFDRRVIRSGELELAVTDVNASVRHAREVAGDFGGFVEASTTRLLSEEDESANLTIEVPSGDFDSVMSALRDGPHVTRIERETTDSRDVTEEFVDLQSRLRNLEATETRFLELLEEAATIDDVMSVEREISRIRGDIEQIEGRLNYLEDRTENSRIHVAFHPDHEEDVEIAGAQFTPGETAREAWNASMEFVGSIGNALIAAVVFFWWGWPLLFVGGLVYYQYRRRHAGNPEYPSS